MPFLKVRADSGSVRVTKVCLGGSGLCSIEPNLVEKQGGELCADPAYSIDRITKTLLSINSLFVFPVRPLFSISFFFDHTRSAIKMHLIDIASVGRVNPSQESPTDLKREKPPRNRDFARVSRVGRVERARFEALLGDAKRWLGELEIALIEDDVAVLILRLKERFLAVDPH
jgi:hypothetical protein